MTNTIPNVPRELLARHLNTIDQHLALTLEGELARSVSEIRALLSAPSPAGVDGLEVVGWYRMDDRKAITPYPSVCATWHKMGVKVGVAYSDSAHAIIDGLRGEVAAAEGKWRLLDKALTASVEAEIDLIDRVTSAMQQRDQQAQRIGELDGLLRSCLPALSDGGCAALANRIDAALSAGNEPKQCT